jgi:hypothetical protein
METAFMTDKRRPSFLIALVASFLAGAAPAIAGDSGWLTGHELRKHMKDLDRSNDLPMRIDCKSGSGSSPQGGAVLFRVTSAPNAKKTRWNWAWGESGQYKKRSAAMERQGLRRVSGASFVRKQSGLKISCAIWHQG